MIITIGGNAGAGKSTLSQFLVDKLGYKYINIGEMRRAVADKMGLNINEFNVLAAQPGNSEKFDKEFDIYQQNLNPRDNIIVDSRLGYHNIPHSLKLFITIDPRIAAQRIFNNKRDQDYADSPEVILEGILARNKQDQERYMNLYNTNPRDTKNYDYVIDTSHKHVWDMYEEIVGFINSKQQSS